MLFITTGLLRVDLVVSEKVRCITSESCGTATDTVLSVTFVNVLTGICVTTLAVLHPAKRMALIINNLIVFILDVLFDLLNDMFHVLMRDLIELFENFTLCISQFLDVLSQRS
jgi:hypothetical protein